MHMDAYCILTFFFGFPGNLGKSMGFLELGDTGHHPWDERLYKKTYEKLPNKNQQNSCRWPSKNNGKTPQIIHFNRVFHCKPSILGALPLFLETPM